MQAPMLLSPLMLFYPSIHLLPVGEEHQLTPKAPLFLNLNLHLTFYKACQYTYNQKEYLIAYPISYSQMQQ